MTVTKALSVGEVLDVLRLGWTVDLVVTDLGPLQSMSLYAFDGAEDIDNPWFSFASPGFDRVTVRRDRIVSVQKSAEQRPFKETLDQLRKSA